MLVNTKDIQIEGSLGGEEVIAMSLDTNSLVHIMSVLADLYSDPAAAVIREYTTNALDSHIAARQDRPVEISSPSRLSPYFIVQDYGLGMSVEDVREVYSKFGASTKRETNEQAGMLGLGSKSALTYTEQFTVRAVKDKRLSIISVSRSANGAGSIEIVDTRWTDEPNGVQIKIPVNRNHYEFGDKIKAFARFVTSPLLIDGAKPKQPDQIKISDRITLFSDTGSYSRGRDRIVMGNVSYPVEGNRFSTGRYSVLYNVPMGAVDFTPSREELVYTARTKATIDQMKAQFQTDFAAHVQHRIDRCASYKEAWAEQNQINSEYNTRVSLQYKGSELPGAYLETKYAYFDANTTTGGLEIQTTNRSLRSIEKTGLIITDWTNKRFARVQAEKITKFLAEHKLTHRSAMLTDEVLYPELFEGWDIVSWNSVKKTKTVKAVTTQGKPMKRWESYSAGSLVLVDTTKDIYYASRTWLDGRGGESNAVSKTSEFYYVTDKESARFKSDYPKAIHMSEFSRKTVLAYLKGLTPEDYDFFKHSVRFTNASAVNVDDVLDPDLKKVLKYAQERTEQRGRYDAFQRAQSAWYKLEYTDRQKPEFKLPDFEQSTPSVILHKYPLLKDGSYYSSNMRDSTLRQHMTDYVNMIYKQNNNI